MNALRTLTAAGRRWLRHRRRPAAEDARSAQRGQVLAIFAVMSIVLLGGAALISDVAWWWTFEQRMQRAADAAALAGSIYLPGNQNLAFSTAVAEATKNGFVHGSGVVVTPRRDPGGNPRKLIVDIDGSVDTNFARVFCWDGGPCLRTVAVGVTGAAEYVLPVPMGSPQNYYGVGFLVDVVTTTVPTEDTTGWASPNIAVSGGRWANPANAYQDGYTREDTNNHSQDWGNLGLQGLIANDPSVVIQGLELRLRFAALEGSGTATDCRVAARVSWDGTNWSDPVTAGPLSETDQNFSLGSGATTAAWGTHTWDRNDFADGRFFVRLTWNDGTPGCSSDRSVHVGEIEVNVTYDWNEPVTLPPAEVDVRSPQGDVLVPQGFWGALQSQGAPNIQGDAYMTYYNTRTSPTNADYQPSNYYQYAVEFPAGSSAGEVWLFDPGFCHVDSNKGTGEYYTLGGTNGSSSFNLVSTFYDLYNTANTPYDTSDDTLVYSSGAAYRSTRWYDTRLNLNNPQTSATPCDNLAWHNDWVRIASGLAGGSTYRLHSYSTDPNSDTDQRNTTALNAFAIWSTATGGTPRVYGLGAMEAYVRLPGGRATEFYLARIAAEHAGKTMVIRLWDPGDTGSLAADLQILGPGASAYTVTPFNHSARRNSVNSYDCSGLRGTGVTSVTTNTGGSSLYNGCWLTIEIALPTTYSAPHPSSDTVTSEGGWWKIRYNMSGSAGSFSTDLTTWEVELRGNPVHLVIE